MKILHLLSQTELTGAEVYAVSLANAQRSDGNTVIIVSDKIHIPFDLPFFSLPISKRSWGQRRRNILSLRKMIQKENIDIVHAHSRASSWVAHWATKGTNAGYVSTIHGRQHLHLSTKLYSVYGQRCIAICENLKKHLIHEVGLNGNRISVIPNGFESFEVASSNKGSVLLLGRTTGPKGEIASKFLVEILPQILEKYSSTTFAMAGGKLSNLSLEAQKSLDVLQKKYSTRLSIHEFVAKSDLNRLIAEAKIVISSGRIAIESLAAGKPLIAIGESHCHGLVTESNYSQAESSNFGDISEKKDPKVDLEQLQTALISFLDEPQLIDLRSKIRDRFSLQEIEKKISKLYFQCLLEKRVSKKFPILMYHKVVESSFLSQHKTYVSTDTFERHLKFFEKQGFTTIGFEEIYHAAINSSPLPKKPIILTFDDGYRSMITRALPLLKKYKMKAVFFVLADFSIQKNFWDEGESEPELLKQEEIRALVDCGMELGAHSFSHQHFTKMSFANCFSEAEQSKKILESLFQTKIFAFAYPFGSVNQTAKDAVSQADFPFGVSTDSGGIEIFDDPMEIFRINIFPQDEKWQLLKKTASWYRNYYFWKRGK
jgi:peptidoglycan/xylan/chitin deacetylase (PgdA/CDA1 family)/glycosyltransferase involved in cell wall biosynthesis